MVGHVEILVSVTLTCFASAEKTAFVTFRSTVCCPAPEKTGVMLCVAAAIALPSIVHAYFQPSATGSTRAFSDAAVNVHGGALFVQPPLIVGCGTLNGNVNESEVSMPAQEPGSGVSDLSTRCTR